MTNKPLQYDSLKAVLQYLEPNLRFQISHRCPSIHKTERSIPLHIDSLKFKNLKWSSGKACAVSVNSTDYMIGTIRVYPDEVETPRTHLKQNEEGGVGTDLDQFGFEDFSSESHLTPGDVAISEQMQMRRVFAHNILRQQEEQLQLLETQLATFRETSTKFKSLEVKTHSEKVRKNLQVEIEKKRTLLLPYLHRRDNTPRGYDTIVQLTMKSKDGLRIIQQFPGKKMYQVEKRLNEFLFGGRKIISVKRLDLFDVSGVIRIPMEFRITAQQLKYKHDKYQHLEAISQFLHVPSLQCLDLYLMSTNPLKHIMIKSAKTLMLEYHANMQTFLQQITNQIVEVQRVGFSAEDFLMLVRNFIETRRPVGICYSFSYNTPELLAETIKNELNGKQLEEGGVKVPIDESSELQITHKMRYRLKFEVVGV